MKMITWNSNLNFEIKTLDWIAQEFFLFKVTLEIPFMHNYHPLPTPPDRLSKGIQIFFFPFCPKFWVFSKRYPIFFLNSNEIFIYSKFAFLFCLCCSISPNLVNSLAKILLAVGGGEENWCCIANNAT